MKREHTAKKTRNHTLNGEDLSRAYGGFGRVDQDRTVCLCSTVKIHEIGGEWKGPAPTKSFWDKALEKLEEAKSGGTAQ